MADEEKPKIHIDSDWKKQAAEEKERLAREAEDQAPKAAAGPQRGGAVGPEGLPEPNFDEIIATFGTQIFMFLGEIPNPSTGQRMLSLPIAKHYIDLLAILEQKTRGNLEPDEKKQLDQLLYEGRMRYVQRAGGGVGPVAGRPGKPPTNEA